MADIVEAAAPQADSVIFHRAADTGRLHLETANLKDLRNKESLAWRVGNDLVKVFAASKCDNPSIISQTLELIDSEAGFEGKISFSVSAIYKGDTRIVNVPVSVKAGNHEIPESVIIQSLLDSVKGSQLVATASLRKEVDEFIQNRTGSIVVEAALEKVAVSTSHPASVLAPIIDVDKTWLPTDIAVGDLLFVGGAKYRVTSGNKGKLSADSDGSFWTLSLVSEMTDGKEQAKHIL